MYNNCMVKKETRDIKKKGGEEKEKGWITIGDNFNNNVNKKRWGDILIFSIWHD